MFAIGLLSLCLTACAGSPPPLVTKTTAVRVEPPELIPCERIDAEEADLRDNGDVWDLKDQAVKLLDTCADQVDAQIKRSQSK
ncbi:Rz1-like lysis system protein LysC [Pseudomonas sp. fls2-241-R2A-110]|uniref:Rz1-like lysis system protein LysC n=1 Tax=Pseudomonas sp. fls2-241-R2A-110 TaxID=3040311 RepID=UPI0025527733|nr:Rz1-like lysis system protein LysC [Pseudomonas sp. fls2-241-R2A-110]